MQAKVKQLRAYGKNCVGCQDNESDVMVSAMDRKEGEPIFYDFFLSQEEAQKFYDELGRVLESNN